MILLLSIFLTNTRFNGSQTLFPFRYSRFEIFKYKLYSYKKLHLTHLYL